MKNSCRLRGLALAIALLVACEDEPVAQLSDGCQTIADCATGDRLACLNGICSRIACERTSTCPPDAACVDGFCDAPQCAQTTDCSTGICYEGECRLGLCEDVSQCESGQACRGEPPRCQEPPNRCLDDRDCPGGRGCVLALGLCELECRADDECGPGSYCDDLCRPECDRDDQCLGSQICRDRRCQDTVQCSPISCARERPFQDPLTCECVGCVNDFDCLVEGFACSDARVCTWCPLRAESDAACAAQGLTLQNGCCVECINDQDCAFGSNLECTSGRCVLANPSECAADEDCAANEVCDNARCRRAGSLSACGSQSDCGETEACHADGLCRLEGECDCESPSKCVAEPGDVRGTCAGCTEACTQDGCAPGELCVIPPGESEGFCADAAFSACE